MPGPAPRPLLANPLPCGRSLYSFLMSWRQSICSCRRTKTLLPWGRQRPREPDTRSLGRKGASASWRCLSCLPPAELHYGRPEGYLPLARLGAGGSSCTCGKSEMPRCRFSTHLRAFATGDRYRCKVPYLIPFNLRRLFACMVCVCVFLYMCAMHVNIALRIGKKEIKMNENIEHVARFSTVLQRALDSIGLRLRVLKCLCMRVRERLCGIGMVFSPRLMINLTSTLP